ncbi:hypothetical protein [Rhizobium sp. LC145]|nr:hypothetical protein [Rhizobium sp. LC145]
MSIVLNNQAALLDKTSRASKMGMNGHQHELTRPPPFHGGISLVA